MMVRWAKLIFAIIVLAVVWLGALPRAANTPKMAAHLEWLDEQGVDPSAMYYTELEMMRPVFERLALDQRHGKNAQPGGSRAAANPQP